VSKNLSKKIFYPNANGETQTFTVPTAVTEMLVTVEIDKENRYLFGNINAGAGLKTDYGVLYAWGANNQGQLGDGTVVNKSVPTAVSKGLKFYQARLGAGSNFALDACGKIWAWGSNINGELGTGNTTTVSTPTAIAGTNRFVKFEVGYQNQVVYCLDHFGNGYAWGANDDGQVGDGTTVVKSSPVACVGSNKFVDFYVHTLTPSVIALDFDGRLYSWGQNKNGSLGFSGAGVSSPTLIVGVSSVVAVSRNQYWLGPAAGNYTSATHALDSNGQAWSWGSNEHGQLGDGTTVTKSSPVAVLGSHIFTRIFGDGGTCFGIKYNGEVWAWGHFRGIPDGSNVSKSSPVLISGMKSLNIFSQIVDGTSKEYAFFSLTTEGKLMAWGSNQLGNLGTNDQTPRSTPTLVIGNYSFLEFAAYQNKCFALSSDGNVYAWGSNSQGALGDNSVTTRSSPVLVAGSLYIDKKVRTDVSRRIVVNPGSNIELQISPFYCAIESEFLSADKVKRVILEYSA